MKTYVRTGIVAVAGTVAFGTAGFAVANAGSAPRTDDTVVKREDTSASWVHSTSLDDDLDRDDDSPTQNTVNTKNTKNTKNTAPTKDTVNTKNTKNTAPTKYTKNTAPTKNTADTTGTRG